MESVHTGMYVGMYGWALNYTRLRATLHVAMDARSVYMGMYGWVPYMSMYGWVPYMSLICPCTAGSRLLESTAACPHDSIASVWDSYMSSPLYVHVWLGPLYVHVRLGPLYVHGVCMSSPSTCRCIESLYMSLYRVPLYVALLSPLYVHVRLGPLYVHVRLGPLYVPYMSMYGWLKAAGVYGGMSPRLHGQTARGSLGHATRIYVRCVARMSGV
jgi:hypothetical protein